MNHDHRGVGGTALAPDDFTYHDLWGKHRGLPELYPLTAHLCDTAAIAGYVFDHFLTPTQRKFLSDGIQGGPRDATRRTRWLRNLVQLHAGLHDIGKATCCFQSQIHDEVEIPEDEIIQHAQASYLAAWDTLSDFEPVGASGAAVDSPRHMLAQSLGGHHGVYPAPLNLTERRHPNGVPGMGEGPWAKARAEIVAVIRRTLGRLKAPREISAPAAHLITGIVIISDWLASQEEYLCRRIASGVEEKAADQFATATRLAPQVVNKAGLATGHLGDLRFAEEFPFTPRGLQADLAEHLPDLLDGPGIVVLCAPTGDGKTEAALHAARLLGRSSGCEGIVFALPTMATADQMHARVASWLTRASEGRATLALSHSTATLVGPDPHSLLSDDGTVAAAGSWLRGTKRALLSEHVVCTVDQVLASVLAAPHSALRMLGLSGKTLVVDEAHAYDPYMQFLLARALAWLGHYRVPVVLASATLPAHVVNHLVEAYTSEPNPLPSLPYPGWAYVPRDASKVGSTVVRAVEAAAPRELSIDVQCDESRDELVLRELEPLAREGGCAAVISNTVADAQRTYTAVREAYPDVEVQLLHARFPAHQRRATTHSVTTRLGTDRDARPERYVLIATQVIEQSLDLDFDLVISDLAPMSQLLQRAGRLHRHDNARPGWASSPRLVVWAPPAMPRSWSYIYDKALLVATARELDLIDAPTVIPEDVPALVEAVYDEGLDSLDEAKLRARAAGTAINHIFLAHLCSIPEPEDLVDLSPLTQSLDPEAILATRLGIPSARCVAVLPDPDGGFRIGTADGPRLEDLPADGEWREFTKAILDHSVPLRIDWLPGDDRFVEQPASWEGDPHLGDLVLLHLPGTTLEGLPCGVCGSRFITFDPELGVVLAHV